MNKYGTYFFTADHHFFHTNIIKYCGRPFENIEEMNETLIDNHNEVVSKHDIVLHAGDFAFTSDKPMVRSVIRRLNGDHKFLMGSHDKWLSGANQIWERRFGDNYIVVCHYAMRVWARSHYNSIHLYGHSHGRLDGIGKSMDIGVDTNNFYPYSLDDILKIMKTKPDNPNIIKDKIS